jgi:hypothetical protein
MPDPVLGMRFDPGGFIYRIRNAAGQPVMSGSYGGGMDSATRDRATARTTQNARANGFSAITYVDASKSMLLAAGNGSAAIPQGKTRNMTKITLTHARKALAATFH